MAKNKKKQNNKKKPAAPAQPKNKAAYEAQRKKYEAATRAVKQAKSKAKKTAERKKNLKQTIRKTSGPKKKSNLKDRYKKVSDRLGTQRDKLKAARKTRRKESKYTERTPGTPGVETPNPELYLTSEQQSEYNDRLYQFQNTLNDLDAALADAVNENKRMNQELLTAYQRDRTSTNDNMAARGLFGSSIRDAALADLSGALTREQMNLQTNLETFNQDITRQRQAARDAWQGFQAIAYKDMVANSMRDRENLPEYEVDPTPGSSQSFSFKQPTKNFRTPKPKMNLRTPKKNNANKRVAGQRQKANTGRMTHKQQPAGRVAVKPQPAQRKPTTPGVNG